MSTNHFPGGSLFNFMAIVPCKAVRDLFGSLASASWACSGKRLHPRTAAPGLMEREQGNHLSRDPYSIHLNIATCKWWCPLVSLYSGEKNMFQMGKMCLLRSPAKLPEFIRVLWLSTLGLLAIASFGPRLKVIHMTLVHVSSCKLL